MLYTEILLKNKCRDEAQRISYIQKIDQKARQLKQLSDHLFEYALVTGETEIKLEGPVPITAAFYDLLSETVSYLEQQGFTVQSDFQGEACYVRIFPDYIARIFDNLTSNVVKYADRTNPVQIQLVHTERSVGIHMKNKKGSVDERTEMMEKMGGRAETQQDAQNFAVVLWFPKVLETYKIN